MYCWGEGTSGQLGLDLQEDDSLVLLPAEVHPLLRHVSLVACGEQHTLFLNEEGNVLSCGSNHRGQLGRQSSLGTKTPAPVQGPTGVVSVACGQEHSLALCQSGEVYSWGRGSEGQLGTGAFKSGVLKPRIIQSLGQIQIFQVACGNHHTLALSRGGAVFSWGQNSLGQLGLGKGTPSQPVPTQVLSLSGVPVSQIAAGGAHSFALSLSGAVYCWGANNAGQLGINRVDEKGTETGRFSPCPAVALKLIGVSYISCGDAHTAVLSKDGGVYTFGDGRHGQLGHNSTTNELKPRRVEQITEQASQVACGSHHTLVYLSSPGLLLAFGSGTCLPAYSCSLAASHCLFLHKDPSLSSFHCLLQVKRHLNPKEIAVFTGKNTNFIQIQPSEVNYPNTKSVCPVTKGELLKIDQERIKKWLTVEFGSKQWKEAKSEIAEICSSASCLIASFLKKWSKKRMHFFGVDIESARGTFRQLQKKHWIINQITTSFMDKLIPSLQSPSPNVEALEIFLILPEVSVFHEEKHIRDLILPLSSAMANLNDTSIKILRNWWSTLQATHLNKILQMFKYALSCMLKSAMRTHEDHQLLKKVLHNMKQLFKANKGAKFRLPVSAFYIDEVVPFVPVVVDMVNWRFYAKLDMDDICPVIFCRFPFALTLLAKVQMLHVDTRLKTVVTEVIQRAPLLPPLPVFRLQVRRTQLTADAFRKLHMAEDATFREQLMVEFQEKQCQDQRGIQREFFCRVISEIIEPESGMFWYNESSTVIWFPTKASVEKKKYYLFGILCGLAVYNYNTVHLPFPLALFKKLVDVKPTLEDLKELEPRVGESLQDLLDYSGDDIEERLALSFSVCWDNKDVDLIPDGKSKPVNKSNRKEFVSAYVDYVFNKAVNGLFDEFRRGFCKVCDAELLSFFQPQELMEAMTGTTDYDWNKFKRNALYKGSYHADHPTVIIFWKVFLDLTLDQKKDFLMFLTGSDRIPVLGIEYVKVTIVPLPSSTEDHYPEANVCFLHLLLPDYTTEKRLRERLLQAFSHSRGSSSVDPE
uniref:Probable E3 ubiquitin-protein ligase HERC6 n=1 Tax=Lepisosteus oculatus TaxID=7918 RepID=W5MSE8_LEPOC